MKILPNQSSLKTRSVKSSATPRQSTSPMPSPSLTSPMPSPSLSMTSPTIDRRMLTSMIATTLIGTLSPARAESPSEEEIQKRVKEVICASNARAEICWKNSFPPKPKPVEEVLEVYPEISPLNIQKYKAEINAPPGTVQVIKKGSVDPRMVKGLRIKEWPVWLSDSIWPVLEKPYPYLYTRTELVLFLEGKVRVTPREGEAVEIEAGDFAVLPKGLDCTWTIVDPVKKYYYEF